MKTEICTTYRVDIWTAGDYDEARRAVRQFCKSEGFCATVTQTTFIYTGGEESGVRVGCLNYPRFPVKSEALYDQAKRLACVLLERLYQHSVLLCADDKSEWISQRDEAKR